MKANRKLIQQLRDRDDAVSPVIAVILMVAITVVLAATVYVWVSGFGGGQQNVVNTQLTAVGGADKVTLKHVSGDALAASAWRVSLTNTTSSTFFCTVTSALSAGGQVVLTNLTELDGDTDADCNGSTGVPAGYGLATIGSGTFQLKVLEVNTNTVLLDREITVT